jgi:hypothetical protein
MTSTTSSVVIPFQLAGAMISSCGEDATQGHMMVGWVLNTRQPITPTASATPGPSVERLKILSEIT